MDQEAVRQALYKLSAGFKDLGDALAEHDPAGKTQTEREIDLMLEFNRPSGKGLTQEEASKACKKHGFFPQTVGGWARGGWLETRTDGLRYITGAGRTWVEDHGRKVPAV
jgi:hypothetical protein